MYRFLAENTERIAKLEHTPFYDGDDCTCWRITDGLQLWDATPREMEKIPALVLTSSLIQMCIRDSPASACPNDRVSQGNFYCSERGGLI